MNTNVDPTLCRDHLGRLMQEESSLLAQLEAQLLREYQLLSDNDVDGLDAAGNTRQACVSQLLKVEDERLALCRMLGKPADLKGIEALLTWCDPQASLLPALRDCSERATRCREQNVKNGILVSARLQRVSSLLGLLNDTGAEKQAYGRSGASGSSAPRAGRLLSASA